MTQETVCRRAHCPYVTKNARFLLECDFSKQYNHYYLKRLERTRLYLEYNCRKKWSPNIPIYNIAEIAKLESAENCIVIGTIFKRMRLQPDVINELSKGNFNVKCERYLGHYTSPDDTLVLEDASESISLIGNINPKKFVTGIVVALLGASIDNGSQFMIREVCFAEPNKELIYDELPPIPLEDHAPVYLMVISGLSFRHDMDKESKLTAALQDLIDFVWAGGKYTDEERSSRVARILVVGNCLSENRLSQNGDALDDSQDDVASRMKKSRQVKPYAESVRAVHHMDDFFAQLSKTIDVDIMPGPDDPSSHLMPQQPFHPCMFPKSCMFSKFNCTTNPHHGIYDDVEILATSGQNIDIISRFSEMNDPIEIMKSHLMWGNCAPSAPDNLYSVPYEDEDPCVIDFIPDVYIAGCQKSFVTDYYEYNVNGGSSEAHTRKSHTLLVTVPKFFETLSCVLINLKDLKCELLSFS